MMDACRWNRRNTVTAAPSLKELDDQEKFWKIGQRKLEEQTEKLLQSQKDFQIEFDKCEAELAKGRKLVRYNTRSR